MAKKYEYKNLTKQQQDCLALVESLGIYELRALARIFGDSSPTTLKRSDHIQIIMDKIISGEDLRPLPLRQGRPFKELENIENILTELSEAAGKDYKLSSTPNIIKNPKKAIFKQIQSEIIAQKLDPINVKGFVFQDNKEFFIYDCEKGKKIYLNQNEKIKESDFITATAVVMNTENEYIIDKILTINYQNAKDYVANDSPYLQTMPSVEKNFGKKKILLGSRYVLECPKLSKEPAKIANFVTDLKNSKTLTIALAANVLFEDSQNINKIGFDNAVLLNYDEQPQEVLSTLKQLIKHINRLQMQGKNVALFVEDIVSLKNIIDSTKMEEDSSMLIRQLVKLAMAGKYDKHTTLFFTMDESDMFDQTFMSAIYKVSEKIEL